MSQEAMRKLRGRVAEWPAGTEVWGKAACFRLRGGIAMNRHFQLMTNVTQVITRDVTIYRAGVREGRASTENGKELQGPRISVEDAHFSPARRGTAPKLTAAFAGP